LRPVAWVVVVAAAASLVTSLWGARARAPWVRAVALAVALAGLAAMVATRPAWEFEVRRPVWLLDASHGRWLERGVVWALSSLALLGATAVRAFGPSPSTRAWWASALLATASLAALAWGAR
jgi:hypothetical protein